MTLTTSPGSGFGFAKALLRMSQREQREVARSEEHTSELQSPCNLVCRLLLEKKNTRNLATCSVRENTNRSQKAVVRFSQRFDQLLMCMMHCPTCAMTTNAFNLYFALVLDCLC